jgi:hypothetical protein
VHYRARRARCWRRRLARAEAICALPLLLAALMSSGLAETLYRSGQNLT